MDEIPPQLTASGSRRAMPLPEGFTQRQIYDMLATISIEGAPQNELASYLEEDFERFLLTWGLVRDCGGAALEIGANPYFTTVLLREFTSLELTLTNSFDPDATGPFPQTISYRSVGADAPADDVLTFEALNVERATFPYPDGSFDVVLFCEVIEHLMEDPVRALLEIKRVLRPGGTLIVTTPNVARLENVARLAAGANLYDPYSGYGAYGRHNREFTRHEMVRLLDFVGFDVPEHFTADVHPHNTDSFMDARRIAPLLHGRLPDLGQYLFCKAINSGPAKAGRPSEIYRSIPPDQLVSWS